MSTDNAPQWFRDAEQRAAAQPMPVPALPDEVTPTALQWPPGFAGHIAAFVYYAAPRPVAEVAIVATLGLLSGICGRQWTVSESGLNTYTILVAKSGIGKEAMFTGISTLINRIANTHPLALKFADFADYASGPALIKEVAVNPCFVNVAGEFGHKFARMANRDNDSAMSSLRRVMTNLYSKSGPDSVAGGIGYSNREKNVESVPGAAFSMIGETTPSTFYSAITEDMMSDGFMSRFSIVEYEGDRPDKNLDRRTEPCPQLVASLTALADHALRLLSQNEYQTVSLDPESTELFNAFEADCDTRIRAAGDNESIRQMYNRAHLKALRIAALLAVGDNHLHPCICLGHAQWAIELIRHDIAVFSKRLKRGDVGDGDDVRERSLLKIAHEWLVPTNEVPKYARQWESMRPHGIVPRKLLQYKTQRLACFENHKLKATWALNDALRTVIDNGHFQEVDKAKLAEQFRFHGKAYRVINLGE